MFVKYAQAKALNYSVNSENAFNNKQRIFYLYQGWIIIDLY